MVQWCGGSEVVMILFCVDIPIMICHDLMMINWDSRLFLLF